MMNFKTIIMAVCCFPFSPALCQEHSAPYDFPIKPGTPEWKLLTTQDEMIQVCQIPERVLSEMSIDALVETCLQYPIMSQIFAYNNMQDGFARFASKFNGLTALLKTRDAGKTLLSRYKGMDPRAYQKDWSNVKKGEFIAAIFYLELLLSQPEILSDLNPAEMKTLVSAAIEKLS